MDDVVQRWLHLEDDVRGLAGLRENLVRRGGPVVLTAPHAVPHERGGATKRADMWTGGLALLLAELTGASAVVRTASDGDPSWQPHPFKHAVAALRPTAVVDLHAMRAQHAVVELGSGAAQGVPAPGITTRLRRALETAGVTTVVDHRFPARGQHTLVQWAARRGVPAVQVEVSVRLTPPFVSDDDAVALVAGLVAGILDVADAGTPAPD